MTKNFEQKRNTKYSNKLDRVCKHNLIEKKARKHLKSDLKWYY